MIFLLLLQPLELSSFGIRTARAALFDAIFGKESEVTVLKKRWFFETLPISLTKPPLKGWKVVN
jgi:hypothetical protein